MVLGVLEKSTDACKAFLLLPSDIDAPPDV